MARPLKVGDICIGVGFILNTERNNSECTIIGPLAIRGGMYSDGHYDKSLCFLVEWDDGDIKQVSPSRLKLKPPKDDQLSWAKGKVKDLLKPIKQLEPAL